MSSSSAVYSQSSATNADKVRRACSAAALDLLESRKLINAQDAEIAALRNAFDGERRVNEMLTELNKMRAAENAALTRVIDAKNEAIAAKDAAVEAQQAVIRKLEKKKRSLSSRITDIAIGAAAALILR